MSQVIIGMDPHKRSATIEVMAADEVVLGGGRYGTDAAGYAAMLAGVRRWPDRIWAVEGSRGIGRHLAARLVADGEQVVDVPPKLSARTRVFTAGQGRKTDAADAHSVTLAATRMRGLHPVTDDTQLEVLRVLADHALRRQGTADRHDPEPAAVGVDKRADQRCSGSCSRAKKPVAADRISIVRSSSLTFRLSSRISFEASVVTPGAWPSSTAACRIHLRSVSGTIPSLRATAVIAAYSDG
jgi:hypothetical protein